MNSAVYDAPHPGRISLAYRGLVEIPDSFFDKSEEIRELDLSHNNLSDPFHCTVNNMLIVWKLAIRRSLSFWGKRFHQLKKVKKSD